MAEACSFDGRGSNACEGFPVVQGRISGTKVVAGLVSLSLAVTLVSWHLVLNSFRPFLHLGMSDPTRN